MVLRVKTWLPKNSKYSQVSSWKRNKDLSNWKYWSSKACVLTLVHNLLVQTFKSQKSRCFLFFWPTYKSRMPSDQLFWINEKRKVETETKFCISAASTRKNYFNLARATHSPPQHCLRTGSHFSSFLWNKDWWSVLFSCVALCFSVLLFVSLCSLLFFGVSLCMDCGYTSDWIYIVILTVCQYINEHLWRILIEYFSLLWNKVNYKHTYF